MNFWHLFGCKIKYFGLTKVPFGLAGCRIIKRETVNLDKDLKRTPIELWQAKYSVRRNEEEDILFGYECKMMATC